MCLIAFAIDANPACPLLIAANRDEFLDRPTAPLHRWALPSGQTVIGGRDLRDGGTWLGVTPSGRVAMLTNVREANPVAGVRSRGELVTRWLESEDGASDFAAVLAANTYAGFNLVVGDFYRREWVSMTNRDPLRPHHDPAPRLHTRPLGSGVYGLSNAALDTAWPKTLHLKRAVADHLGQSLALGQAADADALRPLTQALGSRQTAPRQDLPLTGVASDREEALSSAFVHLPASGYGTRSSLVVSLRSADRPGTWQVELDEWTHSYSAELVGSPGPEAFAPHSRRSETLIW